MVEHCKDEGVGFEVAADLFEVMLLLLLAAVGAETGHRRQAELLLGILVKGAVKSYHGLLPQLHDGNHILPGNRLRIDAEELLVLPISPGPLKVIITGVDGGELGVYGIDTRHGTILDPIHEIIHYRLGRYHAREIHPVSLAVDGIRTQLLADLLVRGPGGKILQTLYDGVPEELGNGRLVELYAVDKGTVLNLGTMIRIYIRKLA